MRKVLILFFAFSTGNFVIAQKEKVRIYNIEFSAKEITGQKSFNTAAKLYQTKLLNPLHEKQIYDYLDELGTYRSDYEVPGNTDLFNLSLQRKDFPFLDSIDFDYYLNVGFDAIANRVPGIETDEKYIALQKRLTDAPTIKEKKKILFESQYSLLRKQLHQSRYDVIVKPFTLEKTNVTQATAELKAKLDSVVISNNLSGNANLRVYISRLADEATKIQGYYYDAQLNPRYISKINYYIVGTPRINIGNDQFAKALSEYVTNDRAAANTGLVAIQLSGTVDKTKVKADSISLALQTKFGIPAAQADKVSADLSFTFTRNETRVFKKRI
jgi:hypothetical protein